MGRMNITSIYDETFDPTKATQPVRKVTKSHKKVTTGNTNITEMIKVNWHV